LSSYGKYTIRNSKGKPVFANAKIGRIRETSAETLDERGLLASVGVVYLWFPKLLAATSGAATMRHPS